MAKTLDENTLESFTGTENWHQWSALFAHCLLTDGAKYIADQAGAYWLMDIIGSHQRSLLSKRQDFQVWKLTVTDIGSKTGYFSGTVTCDDGDDHILVTQNIGYTDFPACGIKLYAIYDGTHTVILLPSEY